jgi:hypothetical protein
MTFAPLHDEDSQLEFYAFAAVRFKVCPVALGWVLGSFASDLDRQHLSLVLYPKDTSASGFKMNRSKFARSKSFVMNRSEKKGGGGLQWDVIGATPFQKRKKKMSQRRIV